MSVAEDDMADTFKHRLVEEPVDLYLNRYLARRLVDALLPTSITPNQITVASGLFGVVCGVLIAFGTWQALIAAVVCLAFSIVFDCADGQLARARGSASRFGRMLDGAADYVTGIALHLGIWGYLLSHGEFPHAWSLLGWVVLAGASLAVHAALFDYRKHWFLTRVRPSFSQSDSASEVEADLRQRTGTLARLAIRIYLAYTRTLESWTPNSEWQGRYLADPDQRAAFLEDCRPFFRLVVWLGPTTHIALILLAAMAAKFFDDSFWWYLYIVIFPMNVMFVIALVWGRTLDTRYPV